MNKIYNLLTVPGTIDKIFVNWGCIIMIDYNNCIVNLACSVLKFFGAEYTHDTLKEVDELLKYDYKNVVVILLDGLGYDAMQYHLPEDSFFNMHLIKKYYSVFPPTTTSATTSLASGLTPAEHGWLGWNLYFSEIDKIVCAFTNTANNKVAADYHVAGRYIPYVSIYEKIKNAGIADAYSVSLYGSNRIETFDGMIEEIKRLCNTPGRKYVYGYWESPDDLMHKFGCYHKLVTDNINTIEAKIENMCRELSDTLVIVTADHGHINVQNYYTLTDYPEIISMLERPISVEPRATAFYLKNEYLEVFPEKFQKYFGDDFLLLPKEEIIERKLFGPGKMHPKFEEFIGDYMAIAVKDKGIVYSDDSVRFVSHHAGLTEKEMVIPLIAICKK